MRLRRETEELREGRKVTAVPLDYRWGWGELDIKP